MGRISDIWKNRKQIMEGIKNSVIRDKFVEQIAEDRMSICNTCEFKGKDCAVPGTDPCCNQCRWSLGFKTRSLSSSCPEDKWKAVVSQEDEDKLNNLK